MENNIITQMSELFEQALEKYKTEGYQNASTHDSVGYELASQKEIDADVETMRKKWQELKECLK